MRGGYQIVDFHNENLSGSSVTIPGIYESIEGNHYKPLLLSGVVLDNVEKADVFAPADISGGNFNFAVYGGTISVTSDNGVTFARNS